MKILSIETSCDETAISIISASGGFERPEFKILAHTVASQISIHQQWGGVVPNIAKREHAKNLCPLLRRALDQAFGKAAETKEVSEIEIKEIEKILEREIDLKEIFLNQISKLPKPDIDAIAVTYGPGLEPALWVGINFARALSLLWQIPLIPTNHMEGHLLSSFANIENNEEIKVESKRDAPIQFPAIALLVSGGHTEIVLVQDWLTYQVIGRTRDDAVGEAFDKVARLLDLPYPGGPEISRLASDYQASLLDGSASVQRSSAFKLPRPMVKSGDFDFSYSGLKTAVLYLVKKIGILSNEDKQAIAWEFQNAALDVLTEKTKSAIEHYGAKTLIVGGGVIANKELKRRFQTDFPAKFPELNLLLPDRDLSTDNATMIAIAAYFRSRKETFQICPEIKAVGNLSL
jgi:N6-L-threonylcarbamoyladenine synthase